MSSPTKIIRLPDPQVPLLPDLRVSSPTLIIVTIHQIHRESWERCLKWMLPDLVEQLQSTRIIQNTNTIRWSILMAPELRLTWGANSRLPSGQHCMNQYWEWDMPIVFKSRRSLGINTRRIYSVTSHPLTQWMSWNGNQRACHPLSTRFPAARERETSFPMRSVSVALPTTNSWLPTVDWWWSIPFTHPNGHREGSQYQTGSGHQDLQQYPPDPGPDWRLEIIIVKS